MAKFNPAQKAVAKPVIAPKSALAPGAKPLPPGSIGMPGGPGGATTYNTGPMPKGGPDYISGAKPMPGSFAGALLGGGAASSQPVMGNNIANTGATAFKRSPATPQSRMKSGGSVSSASKRADGIATKGKTKGRMC